MCNNEKHFEDFYIKYSDCKSCNSKKALECYYANKDKISNQRRKYLEKNEIKPSQKQNDRYIHFKELLRSYVDLEHKLKALDENFSINDTESNQYSYQRNLCQTTQKRLADKQN